MHKPPPYLKVLKIVPSFCMVLNEVIIDSNLFYIRCLINSILMQSEGEREWTDIPTTHLTVLFVPLTLLFVPVCLERWCHIQTLASWRGSLAFWHEEYWLQMAAMTWCKLTLWSTHHPTCGLRCSVLQVFIMWKQPPNIEGTRWAHASRPTVVWETNRVYTWLIHLDTHHLHSQQNLLSLLPGSDSAVPTMPY